LSRHASRQVTVGTGYRAETLALDTGHRHWIQDIGTGYRAETLAPRPHRELLRVAVPSDQVASHCLAGAGGDGVGGGGC
jgi:hypothetical protein